MFLTLVLAATLATSNRVNSCSDAYQTIFTESTKSANDSQFLRAAALRQGAGNVYQACIDSGIALSEPLYPFDGVGAYLVAGDLWHLSGYGTAAQRCLVLAAQALRDVERKSRYLHHDDFYDGHLSLMKAMLRDRKHGKWGVWS